MLVLKMYAMMPGFTCSFFSTSIFLNLKGTCLEGTCWTLVPRGGMDRTQLSLSSGAGISRNRPYPCGNLHSGSELLASEQPVIAQRPSCHALYQVQDTLPSTGYPSQACKTGHTISLHLSHYDPLLGCCGNFLGLPSSLLHLGA